MEIVRLFLTPDAVSPPGTRYNPDCDCVQTSPDGGTTWIDDPAADPRHNDAYRLPPRTGSDPKCDAAEAMMQHFKAQVDQFLGASDAVAFVNAAIQIIGVFFGLIGLFASKLFLIFEALLTIGAITIDAAMTEEVYDQIKCILYCHLDDNGQMTTEGLAAAQSDIDSQIGGVPNVVFDLFAGLWGAVEWSNAGATGEYTGDCSACPDCTVYFCLDIPNPQVGITPATEPCAGAQNTWFYQVQIALNNFGSSGIFMVDKLAFDVVYSGAGIPAGKAYFSHGNGNCTYDEFVEAGDAAAGLQHYELEPAWSSSVNRLFFLASCSNNESNSAGNILQMTNVHIEGHSLAAVPDLLYLFDDYRC